MKAVMTGTGVAGKRFLDHVRDGTAYVSGEGTIQLKAVFNRSRDVAGTFWNGYRVKHESELREYLEKQSDDIITSATK